MRGMDGGDERLEMGVWMMGLWRGIFGRMIAAGERDILRRVMLIRIVH